jgi:hypothetical protein
MGGKHMPTLQELFENDFGAGSVKTASDASALEPSLEKLATELGLFGEVGAVKTAAEAYEGKETKEEEEKEEKAEEKKASIGSLFDNLFPSEEPVGTVKTAEEEKTAAYEEALGSRSYEHFHSRLNARIEKMASTLGTTGSVHEGTEAPQAFPTNHADRAAGGQAINTDPEITDEVKRLTTNVQLAIMSKRLRASTKLKSKSWKKCMLTAMKSLLLHLLTKSTTWIKLLAKRKKTKKTR